MNSVSFFFFFFWASSPLPLFLQTFLCEVFSYSSCTLYAGYTDVSCSVDSFTTFRIRQPSPLQSHIFLNDFSRYSANSFTMFFSTVGYKIFFGSDGPAGLTASSSPRSQLIVIFWRFLVSDLNKKISYGLPVISKLQRSSCSCVSLLKVSFVFLYLCMPWLKYAW